MSLMDQYNQFTKEQSALDPVGINSRVLLVDGTNTYIRCFAATPTMDDDGNHVGGITGFLKSVAAYNRRMHPSRVIVVFDGRGGSQRRRKEHPEYKHNRKSMQRLNRTYDFLTAEDEIKSRRWQLQVLVELLENLPVDILAIDNIEADDTIAYLVELITGMGGTSTIFSTDADFIQLISDSCAVYNPAKKKLYDVESVLDEFGIHPNNFLMYRMIRGDTTDNIPGVKGVALKTLLKNFPFLSESTEYSAELMLEQVGDNKSAAINKIREASVNGLLDKNRSLMSLRDVDIASTTKLAIMKSFDAANPTLDKYNLTLLMNQYTLLSAFTDYDNWLMSSWINLTRYATNK